MKNVLKVFLLAAALVLAMSPAAFAQGLTAVGPIVPYDPVAHTGNGFPQYLQDATGLQVDLPAPPIGDVLGATAPTMVFDAPLVGNQFSQDIGFGSEAFYYIATSAVDLPTGGRALLVLGYEAAFGAGDALNNDQFLFVRTRIRIDTTVAGTYTVTHPWGQEVFTGVGVGIKAINFTFDWGGFTPGFERMLTSPKQGPFLRATNMAVGVDPAVWLGDGVTVGPVTGGIGGINTFKIVGPPNAFGPGINTFETADFSVSGHILAAGTPVPPPPVVIPPGGTVPSTPLTIDRALVSGAARTLSVDVFATSTPTATLTAAIDGGAPVPMAGDGAGKFFAHIVLPRTVLVAPAAVTVNATDPITPPTTLTNPLVDEVTITSALYNARTRTLTIRATTSLRTRPVPTLNVVGFGAIRAGLLRVLNVAAPPANITVQSTHGGKATVPVNIQ